MRIEYFEEMGIKNSYALIFDTFDTPSIPFWPV